jgi:hypothetical protein
MVQLAASPGELGATVRVRNEMGMTALATPGNENTSQSSIRVFNDLRVFPEEANLVHNSFEISGG